jgi:BASS family bile acid:Na+ symporter
MNPDTKALLQKIDIDPKRVIVMLLIMLVVPITIGMLIRAKRPETADKIRLWSRRLAGGVFAVVVAILILGNVKVLGTFAKTALPPVLLTFAIAVALGWGLARVSGLVAADRRAVTLEVAFQNVALAIGMAVVFFPRSPGWRSPRSCGASSTSTGGRRAADQLHARAGGSLNTPDHTRLSVRNCSK